MRVLINFSHDIPQVELDRFHNEIDNKAVYIQHQLHISFRSDILPQIIHAVDVVEERLREHFNSSLKNTGKVYMISPGLTDPAILLYVELMGRTGDPPDLVMMRRDYERGGFKIYRTICGLELRQSARGRREKFKPSKWTCVHCHHQWPIDFPKCLACGADFPLKEVWNC